MSALHLFVLVVFFHDRDSSQMFGNSRLFVPLPRREEALTSRLEPGAFLGRWGGGGDLLIPVFC